MILCVSKGVSNCQKRYKNVIVSRNKLHYSTHHERLLRQCKSYEKFSEKKWIAERIYNKSTRSCSAVSILHFCISQDVWKRSKIYIRFILIQYHESFGAQESENWKTHWKVENSWTTGQKKLPVMSANVDSTSALIIRRPKLCLGAFYSCHRAGFVAKNRNRM